MKNTSFLCFAMGVMALFASCKSEPVGGELAILVEDDGKGFDPASKPEGNGLKNIHSRVNYLKGTIEW